MLVTSNLDSKKISKWTNTCHPKEYQDKPWETEYEMDDNQ